MDATVALALRSGLIRPTHDRAAVDSTGLETRHVSAYYTRRCHRHREHIKHRYPKLSAVVDVHSHLFLSALVDRGPKADDPEFCSVVRQAHRRHSFGVLFADAGYDAEKHHRFLHHSLGVLGVIPPIRGRPLKNRRALPRGFFRSTLAKCWPKKEYGQRWQIETDFSMLKRLLGSALRSRRYQALNNEIILRVLTINLLILWQLLPSFQQSMTVPILKIGTVTYFRQLFEFNHKKNQPQRRPDAED